MIKKLSLDFVSIFIFFCSTRANKVQFQLYLIILPVFLEHVYCFPKISCAVSLRLISVIQITAFLPIIFKGACNIFSSFSELNYFSLQAFYYTYATLLKTVRIQLFFWSILLSNADIYLIFYPFYRCSQRRRKLSQKTANLIKKLITKNTLWTILGQKEIISKNRLITDQFQLLKDIEGLE